MWGFPECNHASKLQQRRINLSRSSTLPLDSAQIFKIAYLKVTPPHLSKNPPIRYGTLSVGRCNLEDGFGFALDPNPSFEIHAVLCFPTRWLKMRSLTPEVLSCVKSQSAFLRKNGWLFDAGANLLENELEEGFWTNILFICMSALCCHFGKFPFTTIFSTS